MGKTTVIAQSALALAAPSIAADVLCASSSPTHVLKRLSGRFGFARTVAMALLFVGAIPRVVDAQLVPERGSHSVNATGFLSCVGGPSPVDSEQSNEVDVVLGAGVSGGIGGASFEASRTLSSSITSERITLGATADSRASSGTTPPCAGSVPGGFANPSVFFRTTQRFLYVHGVAPAVASCGEGSVYTCTGSCSFAVAADGTPLIDVREGADTIVDRILDLGPNAASRSLQARLQAFTAVTTASGPGRAGAGSASLDCSLVVSAVPLEDSDDDGVLDDGDGSGVPGDRTCLGGDRSGCDDNCPFTPNSDQRDRAGVASPGEVGSNAADGIGDACQCGDVSDDGSVDLVDVVLLRRALADGAPVSLPALDKCSAIGDADDCDALDVAAIRDALAGTRQISPVCRAAVP